MALRRLNPGDRIRSIPVEFWNGVVDLINLAKRSSLTFDGQPVEADVWIVLTDKTVVTTNAKWKYACKLWLESYDSTDFVGGAEGKDTFEARNCFERDASNKGYYTATNVTGLKPLPLNKPFKATPVNTKTGFFYRLDVANEPICS